MRAKIPIHDGWLWTGDLARIDDEGFLTIIGRRKNIIVNAHGRNVSPEYIEASLRDVSGVRGAVVVGEGRTVLTALILIEARETISAVKLRLEQHNSTNFSSIEQIGHFIFLSDTPTLRERCFTLTGRPKRNEVDELLRDADYLACVSLS